MASETISTYFNKKAVTLFHPFKKCMSINPFAQAISCSSINITRTDFFSAGHLQFQNNTQQILKKNTSMHGHITILLYVKIKNNVSEKQIYALKALNIIWAEN